MSAVECNADPFLVSFGARLAAQLDRRGWSRREFARRLAVLPQSVSQWVHGVHAPDVEMVAQMAAQLGISTDALLVGIELQRSSQAATDLLAFLHYVRAEHGIDVPERHFATLRALRTNTLGTAEVS